MLRLFFQLKMMESLQFIATMYDELMASVGTSTADVSSAPPIRQEIEAKISSVKAGILANPDLTVLPKLKETLEQSGPASRIPIPKSDLEVIGGRAASKLDQIKQGVAAKDIDVSHALSSDEQARVSKAVVPPKKAPEPVAPAPLAPASANTAPSTSGHLSSFSYQIQAQGLQKVSDAVQTDGGDKVFETGLFVQCNLEADGSMLVSFSDGDRSPFVEFFHIDYCWYVKPSNYKYYNISHVTGSNSILVRTRGDYVFKSSIYPKTMDPNYQAQLWTTKPIDLAVKWYDNTISLDDLKSANWWFKGTTNNGSEPLPMPFTSNQASATPSQYIKAFPQAGLDMLVENGTSDAKQAAMAGNRIKPLNLGEWNTNRDGFFIKLYYYREDGSAKAEIRQNNSQTGAKTSKEFINDFYYDAKSNKWYVDPTTYQMFDFSYSTNSYYGTDNTNCFYYHTVVDGATGNVIYSNNTKGSYNLVQNLEEYVAQKSPNGSQGNMDVEHKSPFLWTSTLDNKTTLGELTNPFAAMNKEQNLQKSSIQKQNAKLLEEAVAVGHEDIKVTNLKIVLQEYSSWDCQATFYDVLDDNTFRKLGEFFHDNKQKAWFVKNESEYKTYNMSSATGGGQIPVIFEQITPGNQAAPPTFGVNLYNIDDTNTQHRMDTSSSANPKDPVMVDSSLLNTGQWRFWTKADLDQVYLKAPLLRKSQSTSGSSVDLTKWVEYPITAYPAPDFVPAGRGRDFAPVNMEGQQINIEYAEVDDVYSTLKFSLPTGQILNEYLIDHSDVPAAPAKMYVNPQHRYYNFDNHKTVKLSFTAFDRNQNRKPSIELNIVDDGYDLDRVEWIYGGDYVQMFELFAGQTGEIKNPMLKQASFKISDLNSSIGKKEIVNFRNPLTAKPFVANDNKHQGRMATGMLFVLEDGGIIDVYGFSDPGLPMLGSDGKLNLFNYDPKPITQFQLDYNTNEIIPTMNTKPLDLFNRNLTDVTSYDNRTNKSLGEFKVSTDNLVGSVSHFYPVNNAPRSTPDHNKAAQISGGYQLIISMASSKVTNWPQDASTMFYGISFLLLGAPNIIDPLAEAPDTGKFDAPVIADDNTIDFSQLYPLATNGPSWSQNESTSPPSEQDIEFVGVNVGEARFVYREFENGARVEMSANVGEKMELINEFYHNTSNDRWYAEPGKYKMIDMGQYFLDSDKGFQMRYYQAWDKNNYLYMDNAPAYYQMCMNIEGTHHTQGTFLQSVSLSKFNNDGIYFEDQAQGRKTSKLYYAVAVPKDAKPTITYYGTLDHSEDFSNDLRELTSHPPALGTQTYANIADMYVYLQHYANGSQTLEFSYDDLASGERVILNRFIRPSGAPVWMFNKAKNPHQKYNIIDVVSSDGQINFHVDIRNADTSQRTDARMMLGSEPAGVIRCGESAKIHPVYALAQSWMTFATDSGVGIAVLQPNIGGPYTLFDRKSI